MPTFKTCTYYILNYYNLVTYILGIYNIVLTFVFGLIIVEHDFTYSFDLNKDKLARRISFTSKINLFSEMLISSLQNKFAIFSI